MDFINEDETGLFRLAGLSSVFISFHFLIEDEARALRLPITANINAFIYRSQSSLFAAKT